MAGKTVRAFEKKTNAKKLPIEFTLRGEPLVALPNISGLVTLDYVAGASSDDNGDQFGAVKLYLDKSFDDENLAKFRKIAEDPAQDVDLDELTEIMSFLIEARSGDRSLAE